MDKNNTNKIDRNMTRDMRKQNIIEYLECLINEIKEGSLEVESSNVTQEVIQLKPEDGWASHYPTGNLQLQIKLKHKKTAEKWLKISSSDLDG